MQLAGTAAIVTGGTGGLGQVICRALAREGARVAVVYERSRQVAEALAAELQAGGAGAFAVQANVADPADAQRVVESALAAFGRLDILVNDAAYNQWVPYSDLEALTPEVWNKLLAVNLSGPFHFCRAVAPTMRRQEQGRIVNITSVAGLAPIGSSIGYAVSKAALIHLTRCLAVALAPHVLVNSVAPGTMEGTRMTANLDSAYTERAIQGALIRRPTAKEDVAEQVLALLRSDSTTGQTICVDGGRVFH
jgi:3-oxoacyl-[acyl-carrier protein] reductase